MVGYFNDDAIVNEVDELLFVDSIHFLYEKSDVKATANKWEAPFNVHDSVFYDLEDQVKILNGHFLHDQGWKGKGVLIAVLDGGFKNVDQLDVFDHLRQRDGVKYTYDYVDQEENVYDDHPHGEQVLSIMAAEKENCMSGAAPMADFILLRTENAIGFEYVIEEDFWLSAAELADSAGADIITSSLGYTEFMNGVDDHSYEDMDGASTWITNAADMASEKGVMVVSSAGNNGDDSWYYISAPADGNKVIAVGAINNQKEIADFSSSGPSYDGRIKPDLVATGQASRMINEYGECALGNGTSYSAPLVTGMLASLKSGYPEVNNDQLYAALMTGASSYGNPGHRSGYGVPDMYKAHLYLKNIEGNEEESNVIVTPSFFRNRLFVRILGHNEMEVSLSLYDMNGRIILEKEAQVWFSGDFITVEPDAALAPGVYLLKVKSDTFEQTKRIVKF